MSAAPKISPAPMHPFRRWRRLADITLADVAKMVESHASTICNIEKGKKTAPPELAAKLSKLTGGAVRLKDFSS